MNITEYVSGALDRRLFPTQAFVLKMMYGEPLSKASRIDFTHPITGVRRSYTEPEYLRFLYDEGRCNIAEQDGPRNHMTLAMGRRAGKTSLLGMTAAYAVHRLIALEDPQAHYGLHPGNSMFVMTVALDRGQAQINHNEVGGLLRCDPTTNLFIEAAERSRITLRTPHDVARRGVVPGFGPMVSETTPKSRIVVTSRPANICGFHGIRASHVGIDEMAYLPDAKDIYNAVVPGMACHYPVNREGGPGGPSDATLVMASTPHGKSGKFYELFRLGFEYPEARYLSLRIPTWELNPTLGPDYYLKMYKDDPCQFLVEHGAEFTHLQS
jgi:hypothetical protein